MELMLHMNSDSENVIFVWLKQTAARIGARVPPGTRARFIHRIHGFIHRTY